MTGGWKRDYDAPAVVYMVTNSTNGKRYIGVTSKGTGRRLREHFSAAKRSGNGAFYKAIRKHGRGSFTIQILKECPSLRDAYAEEIKSIADLKPEYNSTLGGDGQLGRPLSEEAKRRISLANKGKQFHLGKRHTDATKTLLRQMNSTPEAQARWRQFSRMGPSARSRRVVCLDDGIQFESAASAATHYGVSKSSLIELCRGQKYRKSVGGRRFAYEEAA